MHCPWCCPSFSHWVLVCLFFHPSSQPYFLCLLDLPSFLWELYGARMVLMHLVQKSAAPGVHVALARQILRLGKLLQNALRAFAKPFPCYPRRGSTDAPKQARSRHQDAGKTPLQSDSSFFQGVNNHCLGTRCRVARERPPRHSPRALCFRYSQSPDSDAAGQFAAPANSPHCLPQLCSHSSTHDQQSQRQHGTLLQA